MNPHYHPYSDLSAQHPPSPDNNTGFNGGGGGGGGSGGGMSVNISHHPNSHHMSHHLHNGHTNSNSTGAGPNGGPITMDGQQNFQHMNNNIGPMKHCAGCGGKIVERYFLHALDRYWHNSCLKCSCCNAMLADIGSSCYTRSGMILCKPDYSRMFGISGACSACGQTIQANEMVMRTTSQLSNTNANANSPNNGGGQLQHQVFHPSCFACSKCAIQLKPGDRYYLLAGSLVCEQDWQKLIKSSAANATGATPPIRKGKVGRPRRSRD